MISSMMRITLESPALIAVHAWLAGATHRRTPRSGRSGRRAAACLRFRTERLEARMMLDAGMRALVPDLVASSDTGRSDTDNVTFDRTPTLSGSVRGPAAQVRLVIDGRAAGLVPVVDGTWTYSVPSEAALAPGNHTFAVDPIPASGQVGKRSRPLEFGKRSRPLGVEIAATPPTAPTLTLARAADSGTRGDGRTTANEPVFSGVVQRGEVFVSIDGVPAGLVKSDPRTGAWTLKAPRLANGTHDVTAVAVNRAGLQSAATSFAVTVDGERTVMLDGTDGKTVELTASHLLGQGSQGFIVTQVQSGTLQKWSAARNEWIPMPTKPLATDPAALQKAPAVCKLGFNDVLRWTPARGQVGLGAAFAVCPWDTAGGETAPIPRAGTVPGRLVSPTVNETAGVGTKLEWGAPTDGCGCESTRYSIEVTQEDGQTRLYNVASDVKQLWSVQGGTVLRARLWGATKEGAGEPRTYDWVLERKILNRLAYSVATGYSGQSLREEARVQLAASPSGVEGSQASFVLGGSSAAPAYVEVSAVPDAVEAAQGLPAGTRPLVSSDSNALTAADKKVLERNPILARRLFPGTVGGQVQADQVRVHFQAGERLKIAGTVDTSVAGRATIVVEEAPILGDDSVGHWYPKARIAVAADGGYSHLHEVQYGMTAVRVRLELAQPAAAAARGKAPMSAAASSSDVTVPQQAISLDYNAFGITTQPWQVANNQGFDRNGNYYNSNYTGSSTKDPVDGTPITYNGISFPIGPVPTDSKQVGGSKGPQNFVQAKGQTITVGVDPTGSSKRPHDFLYLAGAASNGNQLSQKITLKFTDGTTETWTQSFTDWSNNGSSAKPQPFSGEFLVSTQPERINQQGNLVTTAAYVFASGYNLHGKELASITLPNNDNVGILSAVVADSPAIQVGTVASQVLGQINLTGVDLLQVTIKNESNIGAGGGPLTFFFADNPEAGSVATDSTPATYTQKQVTVPMGQQKTITYVGPSSFSQLNFYVQKADGTCVGPNCSTYLPDWKSGSGDSSKWGANISPSLNSQVTSGQAWTMTVQNAGLGYFAYLDSPAGQNLPGPSGNTPGGAQFQLMTQNEINSQPPWARQLEEEIGITVGLVILTVATAGAGDAAVVGAEVAEEVGDAVAEDAVDEASVDAAPWGSIAGDGAADEDVAVDRFVRSEIQAAGEVGLFFSDISADGPELDEIARGVWADAASDLDAAVEADIAALDEPMIVEVADVPDTGWRRDMAAAEERAAAKAERDAVNKAIKQAFSKGGLF